jgi:isopentenyl diphosphate isomerase/L-lactate dehydrogenase-like FMN-dependent dehydrogenase
VILDSGVRSGADAFKALVTLGLSGCRSVKEIGPEALVAA